MDLLCPLLTLIGLLYLAVVGRRRHEAKRERRVVAAVRRTAGELMHPVKESPP